MNATTIKEYESLKAMALFGLCENLGEGIYGKLHILDSSEYGDSDEVFRIYHADGYCFEVKKYELDEDDGFDDVIIDGYAYSFNSEMFEGFKAISVSDAIQLLKAQ